MEGKRKKKKRVFANRDIYLIRNMSRGHGIGFFEAGNFYPDFILWIVDGDKQYICFIDPKGLHHIEPTDPKLSFYKTIKEIEKQLNDSQVVLNSFVISSTRHAEVSGRHGNKTEDEMAKEHIFFQGNTNYIRNMFDAIIPT